MCLQYKFTSESLCFVKVLKISVFTWVSVIPSYRLSPLNSTQRNGYWYAFETQKLQPEK